MQIYDCNFVLFSKIKLLAFFLGKKIFTQISSVGTPASKEYPLCILLIDPW